jgi:hypothetical protein
MLLYDTVLAQPSETVSSYVLSDLQYEAYPEFSRIIFSSNDKIDFVSYELHDPYRIVIDLLGVSFCELQETAQYDKGLVQSIDITEIPYAQKPQGLDEYFYAVDYIIITPRSDLPYTVSSAENGKIIAIDIGTKDPPGVRVSLLYPAQEHNEGSISSDASNAKDTDPIDKGPIEAKLSTDDGQEVITTYENIIDYINIEITDGSSLVVISTQHEMAYTARRGYYPVSNIVLKPHGRVFTDIEESTQFDTGYIKSVKIIKGGDMPLPKTLDKYYYPVEYIVIEPSADLPFDLYSNDDNTISILEIF